MCSLNSEDGEKVLTWLPGNENDCVTANPDCSNKSWPISIFRPSAETVNVAKCEVHSLLDAGDWALPSKRMGSIEKVLNCGFVLSWIQRACGMLLTTCDAKDRLKMLHAFTESTSRVVEILPILIGMFRGSIFAIWFWVRATQLSSTLL